jgi:membrane-bound lytic murein transglycosylase D
MSREKIIPALVSINILCIGIPLSGQTDTITSPAAGDTSQYEIEVSGFDNNLDSLENLWYVKNAPGETLEAVLPADTVADSVSVMLSDSVYIERLSRLPSVIELTYNRHVRNFINLYTTRRREQVGVMLGLAEYYFPIFEEILSYYDLPLELKYCAIIESALNPRAVSRAGATGIWQFMYGTGRMYNLTINTFVDERRDPVSATYAAARFMKNLYDVFGDWTLVIAAYNCGPGNVNKAIRRSGGKKNYWDIYYYLPRETRGYVPAYIAAAYTMNYYKEHNLEPQPVGLPVPVDTLMINQELHLMQVSEVLGIPIGLLRDINPQYRRDIIPGQSKPFALKIPAEYSLKFIDLQDSIFAYKDSVWFNKAVTTKSPSYYTASRYQPEPPAANMSEIHYIVKSGDNLGFISEWFHVGLSDLKYWNNIDGTMIRAGQKLLIYVPDSKVAHYKKINEMSFAEKQKMIGKDVGTGASQSITNDEALPEDEDEEPGEDFIFYTIRSGDTLWEIAQKYPGVTDTDIMKLNNITDADKIQPGQVIKIKRKS